MLSVTVWHGFRVPGQLLKTLKTEETRRPQIKIRRQTLCLTFDQGGPASLQLDIFQSIESFECFAKPFRFEIGNEIGFFNSASEA